MLIPIYTTNFISNKEEVFNHLKNDLKWLEATEARKEYFMSDIPRSYQYGSGRGIRIYESSPYSNLVLEIQNKLNKDFNCNYNVCFLNRYDNQKQWLGWHSDSSPEMNPEHSIAVVSFGVEREIWWKHKDATGEIPKEQRQLLHNGSLFVMPAGFQQDFVHKIPKVGFECGMRISLTFRNYKE